MSIVYYNDYLKVSDLKECISPLTNSHDEHLFIVTHQTYELWFAQILKELGSIIPKLNAPFDDNKPRIFAINHRLNRVVEIWKLLVQQFAVLETMTPLDFLDFRGSLGTASGFQSVQFKEIEAVLGLKSSTRYHPPNEKDDKGEIKSYQDYYKKTNVTKGGFKDSDREIINMRENSDTLLSATKNWLNRMPFFDENNLWDEYSNDQDKWINYENDRSVKQMNITHPFWKNYLLAYYESLLSDDIEKGKDKELAEIITNGNNSFTGREIRAAIFIMYYRTYPIFQLPFQILTNVIAIDESISDWRYRHLNVVMRMIGSRSGTTGQVSGAEYLKGIVAKNYIFKDLSSLVTYLIPKRRLPELPLKLTSRIGYGY